MSKGQAGTPTAAPRTVNETWIRDRWLPALRSGKYREGKYSLRSARDSFCCLGVACDLLVEEGVLDSWEQKDPTGEFSVEGTVSNFPTAALSFLGIGDAYGPPAIIDGKRYETLATANDTGMGFALIADAIEDWLSSQSAGHAS